MWKEILAAGSSNIMTFVCIFLYRRHVSMASATPSNPSTKGTSNYAQLCRLLVEVGPHVLREIFDRVCPPENLQAVLTNPTNRAKLQTLRKKRVLSTSQWEKLYSVVKSSVSSRNFDSSLLLLLLRNIFGVVLSISEANRDKICQFPEAIAVEMEGGGKNCNNSNNWWAKNVFTQRKCFEKHCSGIIPAGPRNSIYYIACQICRNYKVCI